MIPKTDIIYNYEYAKRLYQGEPDKLADAWQNLVASGEVFEAVFEQAIDKILKAIPEITGYEWTLEKGFLPVYLIMDGESFLEPLTLAVSTDPEQTLYDLIKILVGSNIKTGFVNDQTRDQILQNIISNVIRSAGLDLIDAMSDEDLNLREKYEVDYQMSDLDLQIRPLKHYLEAK